jgi:uncharacterized protein
MRRYVHWIIRHRTLVIALTLVVTAALGSQVNHLRIIIDPNTMLPQEHPYVLATNRVEKIFGSKRVVIIGITPKHGDAFQPHVLAKVHRITAAILDTPAVVKGSVLSLSARRAKNIVGTADGMEARPLMEVVPSTDAEIQALRQAVRANPAYLNTIVSRDERTAAILADFTVEQGGFRAIMGQIRAIADREREPSVDIALGGMPVFLAEIEGYSQRMTVLFPLAVLIVGLIHYEAFRTVQGLLLPLVTALLAVAWGLGVMGLADVPMDVFNVTTPVLILAVAAGHAVQILKRYYEEYHRLRETTLITPREANRAAVVEAVARIGPVMLTAGSVAALGFFSLVVFEISSIRTFGVFTGLGILSALVLEMTFIPALRSLLPAPGAAEGRRQRRIWTWATEAIARLVTGSRRWRIYLGVGLLLALWVRGLTSVVVDNSTKTFFSNNLPIQRDDRVLNGQLGGTNTMFLLIEGRGENALTDPRILRALEATQRFLEQQPHVGKTSSLADFVKRMNRAMHGDDPAYERIPESRALIAQYLLLYSMAGEPGDFDTYVDYDYRAANLWVFLKTDSTAYLQDLLAKLEAFLPAQFGHQARVQIGGSGPQGVALNQVMVYSKILNILQIGGVIFVVTSLVFRSVLAGLLILVPLTLAVLANFGLMGLTGIRLNVATAVISAMAVGIGADYAIYLIYRLREELARGADERTAFRAALVTAGQAILFVASAVAGGYGVLVVSYGFYIHLWFALLFATAMLVSSLGALTILPSLILACRPRFVFGRARRRLVPMSALPAVVLVGLGIGLLPGGARAASLTASEIMKNNYVSTRVQDSLSDATFTLINRNGQERVRKTFGVTKLQPNGVDTMRMTRFVAPPDVRGTATLLIEHSDQDDEIWVYLPALKKVRRLVSANKKDSYVGTDFSYGDVIGHKVEDWEHHLLGAAMVEGQPCYVVESLPRTAAVRATSGYAKRLTYVHQDTSVTIRAEFWDQAGQPLKTFTAADVQLVDPVRGKWQPMRREMVNVQTGHRTILRQETFRANQGISEDRFTTRHLGREP